MVSTLIKLDGGTERRSRSDVGRVLISSLVKEAFNKVLQVKVNEVVLILDFWRMFIELLLSTPSLYV